MRQEADTAVVSSRQRRRATTVAVVSSKGGVGKSTVSANLATALAGLGRYVLLIDMDPQNALRLHHQMPIGDTTGLAVQALRGEEVRGAIFRGPFGVDCLPFGTVAEVDRKAFEQRLASEPHWLKNLLDGLGVPEGGFIIIDTAPGANGYAAQALDACDLAVCVLLPDAASFVTIPSMERMAHEYTDYAPRQGGFKGLYYLVNRMNTARVLCRDVVAALAHELGARMIPGTVQFDSAVEEALAAQTPIMRYAPDSPAARDLGQLAQWTIQHEH